MDYPFTPRTNNDAFGAIRGFVNQVELTIERWITLRDDQFLELERGEDIDLISRTLVSLDGSEEAQKIELHRVLEQVKHLQRPITLRSETVRAVLCNAFVHFHSHPGRSLSFRFTTTASIGQETGSSLPAGTPGILAWEAVRLSANPMYSSPSVGGIRALLDGAAKPAGVSDGSWSLFQDFVRRASTHEFVGFVHRFEWSVGAAAPEALSSTVQARLIEDGHAANSVEAKSVHERLFLHVFRLLSRSGLKSLSREELHAVLNQPTLAAEDRRSLRVLAGMMKDLQTRVEAVERVTADFEAELPRIQHSIDELARQQGIDAAVQYTIALPDLEPPPPVVHGSARLETVGRLWAEMQGQAWTALVGASSTGKTQLAVGVANTHGVAARWIRMRDLTVAEASVRLDAAVEMLGSARTGRSLREWYGSISQWEQPSRLLILDDVPRMRDGDELATRLEALAVACERNGMRLLTSSNHAIPAALGTRHLDTRLQTVSVPPFTDRETQELFRAFGAPPEILTPSYIDILRALTHDGNPALLQAMARYLSHAGWGARIAFSASSTNAYSAEVSEEVVHRLLDTVADNDARDLLHRLNLIRGEFSLRHVTLLAAVQPMVTRPRERFEQLRGPWVQTEAADRFTVSPLARVLGSEDLQASTLQECHLTLAGEIAGRERIHELDAVRAISHFRSGGSPDSAALLLLRGLSTLINAEGEVQRSLMGLIWVDMPLPREISLALRIQIRAFQIRFRVKHRMDFSSLMDDLDILVAESSESDAWSVHTAALIVSLTLVPLNIPRAARYLDLVEQTRTQLPDAVVQLMPPNNTFDPYVTLWQAAATVDDEQDLADWLANLALLDANTRSAAFETEDGDRAAVYIAESFYLREVDRPGPERDWVRVLAILEQIEINGYQLGLEPLWRSAVTHRISVLGHVLKDLSGSRALTESILVRPGLAPRTRFRMRAALGKVYMDAGDLHEAHNWFSAAHQDVAAARPGERVAFLVSLSKLMAPESASGSVAVLEEAVEVARGSEGAQRYLHATALGELSIARWFNDDRKGAFRAFDDAFHQVLETYGGDEEWRKLYVPFAHLAGYFFAQAQPATTRSGTSEVERMPAYRGMFWDARWDVAGTRVAHVAYLYMMIAVFAESVGEHERALEWATRGRTSGGRGEYLHVARSLNHIAEVDTIRSGLFHEALAHAMAEEQALCDAAGLLRTRPDGGYSDTSEAMPEAKAQDADEEIGGFALQIGAVPILLEVGNLRIASPVAYQERLRTAAIACIRVGVDSPRTGGWEAASSVFELLASHASRSEILGVSESALGLTPFASAAVFQLTSLAASLVPGVSLVEALDLQVYVAPHLLVHIRPRPAFGRIAVPFFFEYWTQRFASERIHFARPLRTELHLRDAARLPEPKRLGALFVAIAEGLEVRLPSQLLAKLIVA